MKACAMSFTKKPFAECPFDWAMLPDNATPRAFYEVYCPCNEYEPIPGQIECIWAVEPDNIETVEGV